VYLLNAMLVLALPAVLLGSGGDVLWGHVAVMVTTGVALEATLLLPAMRRLWVAARLDTIRVE
jgi:hypothetical protein